MANSPPYKPIAPIIAQASPTVASCIQNCPPASTDPDGDNVTYSWKYWVNGVDPTWYSFNTFPDANYTWGDTVRQTVELQTESCDIYGACTVSDLSNPITFSLPPPMAGNFNLSYILYAFLLALAILILAYMASFAFQIAHIRPIIIDEVWQLIATVAVALLLVSIQLATDNYLTPILTASNVSGAITTGSQPMMATAQMELGASATSMTNLLNAFSDSSSKLGAEASRGIFCNFLGVGYTLVNCSPLNAFRGSLTLSATVISAALADVYAQQFLLSLASSYAFVFLIPLGLFLRCFKLSRGAGGALIAIGFGFYAVFPTMVVAEQKLLPTITIPSLPTLTGATKCDSSGCWQCDPSETDVNVVYTQFNTYAVSLTDFGLTQPLTYQVIVGTIFMSILNLIVTLGFIRMFAHLIGSEIDVSGLARIS